MFSRPPQVLYTHTASTGSITASNDDLMASLGPYYTHAAVRACIIISAFVPVLTSKYGDELTVLTLVENLLVGSEMGRQTLKSALANPQIS
jgi:hypothetical protein